jgi:DNA-directed RNA polymerase subunit omega
MIIAEADRLEREVGSKYALVILAAKRARHLKEGGTPLVRSASANPLTVAFEEIAASKVRPAGPEEEAVTTLPMKPELEPELELPEEPE